MRNLLRFIQARLLFKGRSPVSAHEKNFGVRIGEWPTRAAKAIEMLHAKVPELGEETSLADWGCGRQTLRNFIPKSWKYIPYDYIERTPDTRLIDFNLEVPAEHTDVIVCLGMLEYVEDFWKVLDAGVHNSRYFLFSYMGPVDEARRLRNGWKPACSFDAIDNFLVSKGSLVLDIYRSELTGPLYLTQGSRK